MGYLIAFMAALLVCILINGFKLSLIKKTYKNQKTCLDNPLILGDINNLREDEKLEFLKLSAFFKDYGFTDEQDFSSMNLINNQNFFYRFLRNYETATILRIICFYHPLKKKVLSSITLYNLTTQNKFICSMNLFATALNPQVKNVKMIFSHNNGDFKEFLTNHISAISKETINKDFVKLSFTETENFINETVTNSKLEDGLLIEKDGFYYNSDKFLKLITINYIKNIFVNKKIFILNLLILLLAFITLGSTWLFPPFLILPALIVLLLYMNFMKLI